MSKLINLAVLSFSSSLAFAGPLTLKGEVDVHITPKNPSGVAQSLTFKLPKYELSTEAKSYLREQLSEYPKNSINTASFSSELPRKS